MNTDSLMESKEPSEHDDFDNGVAIDISVNSDAGVETCDKPCSPQLRRMESLLSRHSSVGAHNKENISYLLDASRNEKRVLLVGAFPKTAGNNCRDDATNTDDSEPESDLSTSTTGCNNTSNDRFRDCPMDQAHLSPQTVNRHPDSPGIRSTFQAPYRPPTKLHELCAQAQTVLDLKEARSTLLQLHLPRKEILNFSRKQDGKGRTPLHLLSENKDISESLDNNTKANYGVDDGLELFPDLVSKVSNDDDHRSREMIVGNFVLDFVYKANPSAAMAKDIEGAFFWSTRISDVNVLRRFSIS
jgi:hypothetical protein